MIKLHSIKSIVLSTIIAVLLGVTGCGGGGHSSGGAGGGNATTILAPNVKTLPSDGSVQISNVTPTGLTLSGNPPNLNPGDIILSLNGEGLLRKVVSAQKTGANVTVTTSQAAITDAIQQCNLSFDKTFVASDIGTFTPAIPGVTLTAASQASIAKLGSNASGPAMPFHLYIPATLSQSMTISGNCSLGLSCPGSALVISGFTVQHLRFVPTLTATAGISVTTNQQVSASTSIHLGTWTLAPFAVGLIEFTPVCDLYTTVDGNITASMSWNPNVTISLGAGFDYAPANGWQPVVSASASGTGFAVQSSASVSLNVTPLKPQITFLFYGVAGPYLNATMPTLALSRSYTSQSDTVATTVDAVFTGGGGFSSGLFPSLNKDFPNLVSLTVHLYSDTGQTLNGTWSGPLSLPAFGDCGPSSGPESFTFSDNNGSAGGPISGTAQYGGDFTGSGPEGEVFQGTRTGNSFSVTFAGNGAVMTGTLSGNSLTIHKQAYCINLSTGAYTTYPYSNTLTLTNAGQLKELMNQYKQSGADSCPGCAPGFAVTP